LRVDHPGHREADRRDLFLLEVVHYLAHRFDDGGDPHLEAAGYAHAHLAGGRVQVFLIRPSGDDRGGLATTLNADDDAGRSRQANNGFPADLLGPHQLLADELGDRLRDRPRREPSPLTQVRLVVRADHERAQQLGPVFFSNSGPRGQQFSQLNRHDPHPWCLR